MPCDTLGTQRVLWARAQVRLLKKSLGLGQWTGFGVRDARWVGKLTDAACSGHWVGRGV